MLRTERENPFSPTTKTSHKLFICVCGLFQTITEDFSVQFVDLVFLSLRARVWRFSLTVRFWNVSLLSYLPRT